jgi:glycosyltransferase involved in cell wall biosynthesis
VSVRVVFDCRPGDACVTGIGRYAKTVGTLLREVPGHACFGLGSDLRWEPGTPIDEEFALPALLEREAIDIFHSPLFHLPAITPCKTVVTIHDAIPAVRLDLATPEFTRLFEEEARDAARRADVVVCPSESAKGDIVRTLNLTAAKVRVIPETPAAHFRVVGEAERASVRERHEIEGDFVLIVGSLEHRKNPVLVLEALARLPKALPLTGVFVGPDAGFDLAGEAAKRGLTDRVRALGVVSDEDLVALYNEAVALVYPSLYEGFGLPIVEAFACGTPVLASNVASIPEVAGDAALIFDPESSAELGDAIYRVGSSPDLREHLSRRGFERLRLFTPDRVREDFARLYSDLGERRP